MTDLGPHLERLGLEQYLDVLLSEGFDTWETLLDIQEGDFEKLNFKLGHRRKLQRAIADFRGIPYERLVGSPAQEVPPWSSKGEDTGAPSVGSGDRGGGQAQETKRKYRRHPKPDDNAPERPPSAYVIFSNKIREEIRGENLNFAQIARLVGDRWQKLDPVLKEPFEAQANAMKERYNIELSAYKRTDLYRDYLQYLADFRAKHAPTEKKPRLEQESSGGSPLSRTFDNPENVMSLAPVHGRLPSASSVSSSAHIPPLHSPSGGPGALVGGQLPGPGHVRYATTPQRGESPPLPPYGRDQWTRPSMSTQSSVSEESLALRSETSESVPRAVAQMTIHTPPTTAIPSLVHSESDPVGRSKYLPAANQQGASGSVRPWAPPALVHRLSGPSVPSPTVTEPAWRGRPPEQRLYPDPARNLPPLQQQQPAIVHGGMALPPPLALGERLPDMSQGQGPRTLPPLPFSSTPSVISGISQPGPAPATFRGSGDIARVYPHLAPASPPIGREARQSATDRPEDDAAKALSGLASSGTTPGARSTSSKGSS